LDPKSHDYKNILVIRIRAFGDTLLTTPTLRGLKKAYPHARLSILMEPGMASIVKGLPYIDGVVPFDRQGMKRLGKWGEFWANLKFYRELRAKKYDLVVDVIGTPRTALMTLFTGAATRVGFAFRFRSYAYNVVQKPARERKYIADFTADTLRALGHEPDNLEMDFEIPTWALQEVARFCKEKDFHVTEKLVMVAPAAGWELKRYPLRLLREAVNLIQKESGLKCVIVWGPGEEDQARQVAEGLTPEPLIAPPTNFEQLAAMLTRAALLITNDGANKHLAVAVGTPTLTLFGPTSDIAWHPPCCPRHRPLRLDLPCMPCEALSCRYGAVPRDPGAVEPVPGRIQPQECLRALTPRRVADEAIKMLKEL
jgi:ADP-heptose:LPS heptosyltransferase